MELIHGGDVTGYEIRFGRPPLDFSASLNPLGMPPSVRAAAKNAVDESFAYPDPLCRGLISLLARRKGVPEECILCGNGAADLVYRFALAARPRRALLTAPTFAEYERALAAVDCVVEYFPLRREDGFAVGESILDAVSDDIDVLFLCQPNNPTGTLMPADLAVALLERCERTNTVLFADECFCCFVENPERHSLVRRVPGNPRLFVLDSFTKLYGMAGIRLGYGLTCDKGLLAAMAAAGQPWSVSTVALAAGSAALEETGYVEQSRRLLLRAKGPLVDGLRRRGFTVWGSEANYVFFHSPRADLNELLMPEGMMIRDCRNYRGLGPGYYRVSVRLEEENERLLAALDRIMDE